MSCFIPRSRGETRHSERSTDRRKKKDGFMRAMPVCRGQRPVCSRDAGFGSCDGNSCSVCQASLQLHQSAPDSLACSGVSLGTQLPRAGGYRRQKDSHGLLPTMLMSAEEY